MFQDGGSNDVTHTTTTEVNQEFSIYLHVLFLSTTEGQPHRAFGQETMLANSKSWKAGSGSDW